MLITGESGVYRMSTPDAIEKHPDSGANKPQDSANGNAGEDGGKNQSQPAKGMLFILIILLFILLLLSFCCHILFRQVYRVLLVPKQNPCL